MPDRTRRIIAGALAVVAVSCGSTGRRTSSAPSRTTNAASSTAGVAAATLQVVTGPWRLPSPRDRAAVVTDGRSILLLGGRDAAKTSRTSVLRVDPVTGAATPVGDLTVAVHDTAGALLAGRAVVFGGGGASTVATVQALPLAGGRASVVGRLPQPRSDLTAVTIGATAYVVGGFDGARFTPEVLATSDGVTFTPVAALPVGVRYPATVALGHRLYVFGGVTATTESGTGGDSTAIQEVDLDTRKARVVVQMATPLSHASAVVLRGQVFVIGGRVDGRASNRVARFDPTTGALTPVGSLPVGLSDAAAVVVGGVGYVLGGEVAAPVADVVLLRVN